MASNRIRSLRNVGTRINRMDSRVSSSLRRPAPTKLATNFIITDNYVRYSVTEPILNPNSVSNEKIDDGAVDTGEIADGAVTSGELDIDAVDGKNITSCDITDSTIDNCDITTGTMDGTEITNVAITKSTLTGADVILDGCTLTNSLINTITAISGGIIISATPLVVDGSFVVTGGTTMTVGDGGFGVGAGASGLQMADGNVSVSAGSFVNFTINNFPLNTRQEYLALQTRVFNLENQVSALQSEVAGKAPLGHSH